MGQQARSHSARRARRGLALLDVLAVAATLGAAAGVALPQLAQARARAIQIKDMTQVRGITQSFIIWGVNDKGRYPTASRLDRQHATLPAGTPKDASASLLSLLVFNGFLPTEILVSPAEVGSVAVDDDYQVTSPPAAQRPGDALFDPAFRGTPLDTAAGGEVGTPSNNSYALAIPTGARARTWAKTDAADEPIVANRGPQYVGGPGAWRLRPDSAFGEHSRTLRIHGDGNTWEGAIGFNDTHAEFFARPDPGRVVLAGHPEGQPRADNIFQAEHDPSGRPIDEAVHAVRGGDGRGRVLASAGGEPSPDTNALDRDNAYLRPTIARASAAPAPDGAQAVDIWID